MIQVYCYDQDGYFTISKQVDKLGDFMTTDSWEGLYKPKRVNDRWAEGATEEEIKNWYKPVKNPPSQMEVLQTELIATNQYVTELELILIEKGVM